MRIHRLTYYLFFFALQDPLKELKGTKRKESSVTSQPEEPVDQIRSEADSSAEDNVQDPDSTSSPPTKKIKTDADKLQTKKLEGLQSLSSADVDNLDDSKPVRRNPARQAKVNSLTKDIQGVV
jgi:hypothetical protein